MILALGLSALALASLTSASPLEKRAPSVSSSLKDCLAKSGAQLTYPGDSDYNSLARAENEILTINPSVIVRPKHDTTAAKVVACVAAEGGKQKIAPRGGGHSYEGYSLGGADGYVVLDLAKMSEIQVDKDSKTAVVGSGVRLGPLAKALADQGFALPHGTCPQVGVAGHSLGGGYGYATRWGGYLMDRVKSMQVIKVDGTIVTASPSGEYSDLFWGLMGAGANNFGTVTSFTYSLLDAPSKTVGFTYTYGSQDDCVSALLGLQDLTSQAGGLPKELTGELLWYGTGTGADGGCTFSGFHVNASKKTHASAIQKLHDAAKVQPSKSDVKSYSAWSDAQLSVMGSFDVDVAADHEPYYAKSLMTPADVRYTRSTASALYRKLQSYVGIEGTGNSISFGMLGPDSASNRIASDATAYAHRDSLFVSQYYSYGMPSSNSNGQQDRVYNAFQDMIDTAKKAGPSSQWGSYSNYVDHKLSNFGEAYYGSNLAKLKSLKRKYDPANILDYAQGLFRA